MEMQGSERITASRETVWAALNDPEILRTCIPGCQSLEKTDNTTMKATVKLKVGVVSASFNGEVTLKDIDAPNGYRIEGEGKGGVAAPYAIGEMPQVADCPSHKSDVLTVLARASKTKLFCA